MQRAPTAINWPALALATAIALGITTGVPVMMAHPPVAPHVDMVAHVTPAATEVAILPERIDVVAVRAPVHSRWFSLASFRHRG